MSEQNKAIMRRFYEEVFNRGNLTVAEDVFATDFIEHEIFPGMAPGLEGFKQMVSAARAAFTDFRVSADDMLAEGDKVAVRYTTSGTHRGGFVGVAPTGKRVTLTGIDINRFTGGKIVEHWGQSDSLGLMQQLGLVPSMG